MNMKHETYMLEVKTKDENITIFPHARWNYNTKQLEIFNQKNDFINNIPFDEIEWFRKK